MSTSGPTIVFLSLPGEADALGEELARGLSEIGISHEFVDVAPSYYDAILDRLEAGSVPVILKSRRSDHS